MSSECHNLFSQESIVTASFSKKTIRLQAEMAVGSRRQQHWVLAVVLRGSGPQDEVSLAMS